MSEHKPLYNVARGQSDTLSLIPPVVFTGVTLRYIPLPARMDRLQRFIDQFLNLGTREKPRGDNWFDVAAPMVFLTLVDYGRMAVAAVNEGWTAQYEIAFQVPLVWYKRRGDEFVLDSMAWVSPFIFVDNVMSMNTGREVYGWEKTLASITTSPDAWTQREMGTEHIVSVSGHGVSHTYAGELEHVGSILSITHQAVGRMPPDFHQLLSPLPQALDAMVAMPRSMMEIFRGVFEGPGTVPLNLFDPKTYPGWLSNESWTSTDQVPPLGEQARHGLDYLGALVQMATGPVNTINLKQFRAAGEAGYSKAAYQAITNAPIGFLSIDAMGPMGPANAAVGQRDGGLRVLIPPSNFDIVASMGLEVFERTWGPHGESVDVIVPIYPFWMRADMSYGAGENVETRSLLDTKDPGPPECKDGQPTADTKLPDYNTALGAASQQLLGPFESAKSTIRVLPLQADGAKLQRFVGQYLNELDLPRNDRFEAWGDFVYMVIGSLDDTVSINNPIQRRDILSVSFYVPVRWYRTEQSKDEDGEQSQGEERMVGVGFVAPFSFSDDPEQAITLTEVGGTQTMAGTIEGPPDVWLDDSGPDPATPQTLMRLSAEVLPALNMGAKVENRVVAEVLRGAAPHSHDDDVEWRRVVAKWGEALRRKHQAMIDSYRSDEEGFHTLWTLALEVLANGKSFRSITLKQFRDAAQPDRACYQALVQGSMKILGDIYDMRELPHVVHVRLPRYPTLPIADLLGLVPKTTKIEGEGLVDYFQPLRPFWFRASTRYDTGRCIYRRTTGEWDEVSAPDCYFTPPRTDLGPDLLHRVNARGRNLQRLRETVQDWLREARGARDAGPDSSSFSRFRSFTAQDAQRAIESIDPQPVIEAILSKEWAHWGTPRWLEAKRRVERLVRIHHKHEKHDHGPGANLSFEHAKEIIQAAGALRALWANPKAGPLGQRPLFCVPERSIGGREGKLYFEKWDAMGDTTHWRFLEAVYSNSPGTNTISKALLEELEWMFEQLKKVDHTLLFSELLGQNFGHLPQVPFSPDDDDFDEHDEHDEHEPAGLLPDLPSLFDLD